MPPTIATPWAPRTVLSQTGTESALTLVTTPVVDSCKMALSVEAPTASEDPGPRRWGETARERREPRARRETGHAAGHRDDQRLDEDLCNHAPTRPPDRTERADRAHSLRDVAEGEHGSQREDSHEYDETGDRTDGLARSAALVSDPETSAASWRELGIAALGSSQCVAELTAFTDPAGVAQTSASLTVVPAPASDWRIPSGRWTSPEPAANVGRPPRPRTRSCR